MKKQLFSVASFCFFLYDDPYFQIDWPIKISESSEKDKNFPDFNLDWHGISLLSGFT